MIRPRPIIAVTTGDPAGIGPEVVAAALASPRLPKGVTFHVLGDTSPGSSIVGHPTKATAREAFRQLRLSVEGALEGRWAGIVTGPICKKNMSAIGFAFPGHTEFFASSFGLNPDAVTMCMADRALKIFLVTTHCSLRSAISGLSPKRIERTVRHALTFLSKNAKNTSDKDIRLAVAALNPHAGEGGLMGREEIDLIEPRLAKIREKLGLGKDALPLIPADTAFYRTAKRHEFDGVICLYHDQGLIPFKLLGFDTGVNVTLGLPFCRTSPDHGTAFDIAGKGLANADSMVQAMRLAAECVKREQAIKANLRSLGYGE
jgi:4-hydroxythreonine-4-phosphate dehydrogenase